MIFVLTLFLRAKQNGMIQMALIMTVSIMSLKRNPVGKILVV